MQKAQPPKKPVRRRQNAIALGYRRTPIEEDTAGRLFRVRCKDWENLWGENLTYDEANRLKEQVATRGKSRTARVEDMEIPAPDWYLEQEGIESLPVATPAVTTDPQLEAMRKKAVAAAAAAAQTAQQQHVKAAARDRSSIGTAGRVPKAPRRPVPLISTGDVSDDDDGDLSELLAGAGDEPSDAEIAHAKSVVERDIAESTATARAMYEASTPTPRTSWESLSKADQASWRFQANAVASSKNGAGSVGSPE